MNIRHFTYLQEPDAEKLLFTELERMKEAIALYPELRPVTVALGGGYGRGEGGVFFRNGKGTLYNDLDFFVFAETGDKRKTDRILRGIAAESEARLHINVDFAPCRNMAHLRRNGDTLMYQELKHGFYLVHGTADFAEELPELAPGELPWQEAVRLLMNRGMGLLLAGEKFRERDFIRRNLHKAALGSGDALLINAGEYRWRLGERRSALLNMAIPAPFKKLYIDSVDFKIRPYDNGYDSLEELRENIRRFFLFAVQITAGENIHDSCVKHGQCTLLNGVKRIVRTRHFDFSVTCLDSPQTVILGEIYTLLQGGYPVIPGRLLRAWEKFN